MRYHKLLLGITVIAFVLVLADAEPGDPLNPSQLGESMSMPLPQELIQDAKDAGVITKSNPLYNSDSNQPGFSVVPQSEAYADDSLEGVNVTGTWSFNFTRRDNEWMKLYLIQNEDRIMGRGVINRGNETENATASGLISGEKMSLSVMPAGVLELYKLNLSLSSLDAGTYTVYMADGGTQSGEVTFAVSSNIFKSASNVAEDGPSAYAKRDSAASTPVQLSGTQGASGRISSAVSTSMSSGGGSMSGDSSSSAFSSSVV